MRKKERKDQDIKRLRELYLKLKEIMAELYEIECRHPKAKHFRKVMEETLMELNKADHLVIAEAYTLKEEEQDSNDEEEVSNE